MAEPQAPVPGQNPDVAWALADLAARLPALKRRRDYRDGRHLPVIPPGQTLSPLLYALLEDLADNLCDDVVAEPASRLEVTNWTEPQDDDAGDDQDPTPTPADRGQRAQDLWERTRGPARLTSWLEEAFAMGDGYLIADRRDGPDGARGVPYWTPQAPEQMAVRYLPDQVDTLDVAAKVWLEGKGWRLNLYYGPSSPATDYKPAGSRLERYATKGTSPGGGLPQARAFVAMAADPATGEPDTGARDWVRHPVFHYPVQEVGRYGRSLLTPVIPVQDLLNKAVVDLVVAMEETALDQRYGTGIQLETDPATGATIPLRRRARSAGDMLTTASKDASFGSFAGTDPRPFLDVITQHRGEIARKGKLPPYTVSTSGEVPSGLSLLVQEGQQVKFCKAVQRDAGWLLRELMAYLLTLDGTPTEPEDLDVEWANPATRDELAIWELAVLKRDAGVPQNVVLMEGGYDQGEVDAWLEDAETMDGGRLSRPGAGIVGIGNGSALGLPAAPAGSQAPLTPTGSQALGAAPVPVAPTPDTGDDDAADLKARVDALGTLIRSGVTPESAAAAVGLGRLQFTGAVPVTLRQPADQAQGLEDA